MKKQLCIVLFILLAAVTLFAQAPAFTVTGIDGKSATFTAADLKQLPRQTFTAVDHKTKAEQHYEGVLLTDLLAKVRVPADKAPHGAEYRQYLEVSAPDGYRVILSMGEMLSSPHRKAVLVVDTVDSKPLDAKNGPLKLVIPDDGGQGRWVRGAVKARIVPIP